MTQTSTTTRLAPHPDRLFPADPGARAVARTVYDAVKDAPIISPHGHVDAALIAADQPFPDPAALLITPDHYVLRLLHANGVGLEALGRADLSGTHHEPPGRTIWRQLAEHWDDFLGTPVRYWFETELHDVFGLDQAPSAGNADAQYDHIADLLASPAFRPRALFDSFGIEVLATTDGPADDLAAHAQLAADPGFTGRVLPTFRADAVFDPTRSDWRPVVASIAEASGIDTGTHAGLLAALRARRRYFIEHGATATDTGVLDAGSAPLSAGERERIHAAALRDPSSVTESEATAYRHDMLYRWAEMSVEDGLVMQLHPGVIRNHHTPTLERFGPDTGHDLPAVGSFTEPLRPLLEAFGTAPGFHLVLFTVDETVFSREIGPLAGFYPAVYAGAPWWFIDTPAAIGRYRSAVTDSASFTKTSGFIDDTRAYCSIPARHDMARRADAAYLASLVVTHQISEEDAVHTARRIVSDIPRATFKL
ncbi:glucuronate isomerase [Curtobacterium aurantiacum]|uniref:Uronate isomerase n=1 Tax=Curtobacterium aurantiacum TaxID=3236919 RepID=A0ABS5VIM5_9MICO|nr:glucuronate isomerase [Curtobacterium flaccumfaciens]MBT1546116.1 glucuronate isomerase [Curtobacterium flaccumfaciens pv. flaccumfaciens]MBT1589323.1 glucuronate isomerase [Curtobacterium flaccumfaciens pv. flaccumfaciens]